MKTMIILAALLTVGVAQAHIPVTESATILDANGDGSNLVGNYRVTDDCNGGLLDPQSKGLAIFKHNTAWENETGGVKTKHAELSYTYMRKQSKGKFEVKTGKIVLNGLKKITNLKKVDNETVETVVSYQATNIEVTGDLADDNKDGAYPVAFNADGSLSIRGKDCDQRVDLKPTTDVVP